MAQGESAFTQEELQAQAHLASLVDRQIEMGVPPALALGVLASALGRVAATEGLPREDLFTVFSWVERAFDGALEGQAAREREQAP